MNPRQVKIEKLQVRVQGPRPSDAQIRELTERATRQAVERMQAGDPAKVDRVTVRISAKGGGK